MKKIETNELKSIQIEILQYVHDFCKKNGIVYSLCGGTLIGAVRHSGYIPWDDDLDIMMPRPDYERFCKTFNGNSENYHFSYCGNDKGHYLPFGKVSDTRTVVYETKHQRLLGEIGVNIDVFPIDGTPNDSEKRDAYWKKMFRLRSLNSFMFQRTLSTEHGIRKIIRRILFVLFKALPANFWAKRINSFAMKNDFSSSNIVACSVFGYFGRGEELLATNWKEMIELDFEGKKINALCGYHDYLSGIYGDYMELPPKEKRVPPHSANAFWR